MNSFKRFFHLISYLQYPIILGALYFYIPFIISLLDDKPDLAQLNYMLILMGVALSVSTLQDTTKTQNSFSRKIWESPRKGKIAIIFFALVAFTCITYGFVLFYISVNDNAENIAIGTVALGIGMVGLLKSAIEMFENHRKDKQPIAEVKETQ